MRIKAHTVNWFLRKIFGIVCRIDTSELKKIPSEGPLILVANHINFLDVPVLIPHLDNPLVTGIAKKETWDNPLFRFLFTVWEAIPIERGTIDREAFRLSFEALIDGKILAVAPEGTRSKDGRMQKGKTGIVTLAERSKSPLIPVGLYGHETFWQNFKRLKRTNFNIVVGTTFRLNLNGEHLSRTTREAVTDEIMYKIAELLPERYRGEYHYDDKVDYKYLSNE